MKTLLPDRVGSYNDFSHAGTPIAWHSTRGPFERGEQRDGAILRRPLQKQVKGNAMSGKVFAGIARAGAVAVLALAAGAAHAAKYTGTWDPPYGLPFTGMGWGGSATFSFDGGCLIETGTVSGSCTGSFEVVSATVRFYALANPATTVATLTWSDPTTDLISATFSGGMLTSIHSGYLGLPADGLLDAGRETTVADFGLDNYSFYLEFLPTGARLTHVWNVIPDPLSPIDPESCLGVPGLITAGICGLSGTDDLPVRMDFAAVVEPVSEPQTYALMLASLAAAGLATRRRRR